MLKLIEATEKINVLGNAYMALVFINGEIIPNLGIKESFKIGKDPDKSGIKVQDDKNNNIVKLYYNDLSPEAYESIGLGIGDDFEDLLGYGYVTEEVITTSFIKASLEACKSQEELDKCKEKIKKALHPNKEQNKEQGKEGTYFYVPSMKGYVKRNSNNFGAVPTKSQFIEAKREVKELDLDAIMVG
jgi:hypothetical protein